MRKLTAILLSLIVLSCCIFTVSAREYSRVTDQARLLSSEEISYLEDYAAILKESYNIDAVIVTTDSLNGYSAQDYADNFYDNSGYGNDGVLFLLAMNEREWYISTSGSMIYILTDYGVQQVGNGIIPYLSDGLWFEGLCTYLHSLPKYLNAYKDGAPIDGHADYSGDYYHGTQEEILYYGEDYIANFGISMICGIVVAGIVILIMRSSMNTKRAKRSASEYMKAGSWKVTEHRDLFLYSRVTKTAKPQNTTSGGGSSVHHSSGGRSHGGGGGRF